MTVDTQRGILYAPIAAPAWDRYGGDRHGDNLFSSSVVALNARTGERLWHFQVVHHDIWDFDTQAPPLLLEVPRRGGAATPAVAIVSKAGYFFLLDRVSGKPLFDVEERRVPASDVAGEKAARTQPIPAKPEPFARTQFSASDVATVTPELERYCRAWIEDLGMRMGGPVPADRARADHHISRPARRRELGRGFLRSRPRAVLREREQPRPGRAVDSARRRHDDECRARRPAGFRTARESCHASNRRGGL